MVQHIVHNMVQYMVQAVLPTTMHAYKLMLRALCTQQQAQLWWRCRMDGWF